MNSGTSNLNLGWLSFVFSRHCYGLGQEKDYWMPCILLNTVGEDRAKVLVFGDRFWRGREHIKRVRYVDADRLIERKGLE